MSEALLIIDVQNDFTPGGALGVPEGDAVVAHVNDLIASGRFDIVLATRDWHPADHGSFDTARPARSLARPLRAGDVRAPSSTRTSTTRGSTGSSTRARTATPRATRRSTTTGLAAGLRDAGVDAVTVVGLATDYCVRDTALDALREGFAVTVDAAGTRAVDVQARRRRARARGDPRRRRDRDLTGHTDPAAQVGILTA